MERRNAWKVYDQTELEKLDKINETYKNCLDDGKTERECITLAVKKAEAAGYKNLKELQKEHVKLKAGDKVYAVCMDKSIALFIIGQEPLENGMNILGAHIDSPRIDVKQNPLYENEELAYLDTHYYGGIKKYQWVTLPLAIHGVIAKKDGTIVPVSIGDEEEDPVFVITDLLVHLASKQLEKKGSVVVEGEKLDLLIGSRPLEQDPSLDQEEKEAVRANVMELLKKYYDMEEEDFLSAELEIVPAGKARDCGLDRSMVLAYGQDDRVCAYTALMAELSTKNPEHTTFTILTDKEEIGSVGNTGLHSDYVHHAVEDLAESFGADTKTVLRHSICLSSDVNAAYDPTFASVYESRNSSYVNKGCVLTKYTGARGKSGSSDASAETMAKVIDIMEENGVYWQTGELGAVDAGGGGTIAQYVAMMDVDVVDLGVPILSMHAPFELASKLDVYNTYKAFCAFYK